MKPKSKASIKEDQRSLLTFLLAYPDGKILLCRKFGYKSTVAIDRWEERGFPMRLRESIMNFMDIMIGKRAKESENTEVIRKRLQSVGRYYL